MSDSPQYEAFRAFARSEIRAARLEMKAELAKELKAELQESFTRSAPQVIEGPPGPAGKDGASGKDGTNGIDGKDGAPGIGEKGERGADGINGKDGAPSTVPGPKGDTGERGADGIATREEIVEIVEERAADINVRTFADTYQGVYEPNRTYSRGVLVTWGGSLWLSQAEAKTKPGESADWKLVVKKGSDGRK